MQSAQKFQPPSGGCVLKRIMYYFVQFIKLPAAFRRLCVETMKNLLKKIGVGASRLQAAVC